MGEKHTDHKKARRGAAVQTHAIAKSQSKSKQGFTKTKAFTQSERTVCTECFEYHWGCKT